MKNRWGQLFASYGDGQVVMPGVEPKTVAQALAGLAAAAALVVGLAYALKKKKSA